MSHWITNRQIESCGVAINRTFKREGKTLSEYSLTNQSARPVEWRMVKVKEMLKVAVVKLKNHMFETENFEEELVA